MGSRIGDFVVDLQALAEQTDIFPVEDAAAVFSQVRQPAVICPTFIQSRYNLDIFHYGTVSGMWDIDAPTDLMCLPTAAGTTRTATIE